MTLHSPASPPRWLGVFTTSRRLISCNLESEDCVASGARRLRRRRGLGRRGGVVPASRPARRRARPARWRRVPAAAAAAAAPAAAAAAAALAAASPARLWRRLNPHASRPPPPGRRGATRAAAGVVPLPDHARRHGAASDDALRHDIRLGAARALDPVARDVPDGRMRRPSPPWRPRAPTLRIRFPRIPKGLP